MVELEPAGDKTLVRLTHQGLTPEQAAGHTEGWTHYLERLGDAASVGDAGLDPWATGGDELDHLSAAEASWALCQQVMLAFTPEHRELPTPCSEFTVHDLVEHLMGSLRGLGGDGRRRDPRARSRQPRAEDYIAQAAEPALAAWRARGIEGEVPFGGGKAPAALPAGILSLEFFVHAWDFARATDQPFSPPEPLTAFVTGIAEQIIQPDNRGDGKGFAEIDRAQCTTPSRQADGLHRPFDLKIEFAVDHAAARTELRAAELALMQQRESVAAMRRDLPPGPIVDDYEFGSSNGPVRLSELFGAADRPLVLYHFMFGAKQTSPCPMCSMWADGWNAVEHHLAENLDLALVTAATVDDNERLAVEHGWTQLRWLSAVGTTFKTDFGSQDGDGNQQPFVTVFELDAGAPRLTYSGGAHIDGDHWRGIDLLSPVWHFLDLTHTGRGVWMPRLGATG